MGATFDWMIAWLLVSAAAITIAGVSSRMFSKRSKKLADELQELTENNIEAVRKIIKEQLSPTIHLHDGLHSVTNRAAHIIEEVATYDNAPDRRIEFFGAASMATAEDTRPGSDVVRDDQKSSSQHYREALNEAIKGNVLMKRYISLFTDDQLRDRSRGVKEQYHRWLKHQEKMLEDYPRYELVHVPRAPSWGTNMARIITKKHVMEITGNGRAAIVITDEHIAERLREYMHDSVIGKKPRHEPKVYGASSELPDWLGEFQRIVNSAHEIYLEAKAEYEKEQQKTSEPQGMGNDSPGESSRLPKQPTVKQ